MLRNNRNDQTRPLYLSRADFPSPSPSVGVVGSPFTRLPLRRGYDGRSTDGCPSPLPPPPPPDALSGGPRAGEHHMAPALPRRKRSESPPCVRDTTRPHILLFAPGGFFPSLAWFSEAGQWVPRPSRTVSRLYKVSGQPGEPVGRGWTNPPHRNGTVFAGGLDCSTASI